MVYGVLMGVLALVEHIFTAWVLLVAL